MITQVERFIAWRYLHAKKEEGFVSTIAAFSFVGIVLGVFALIVVSAIMGGFRQNLVDQILSLNGHLTIESTQGVFIYADDKLISQLPAYENVESVTALIDEQVLLNSDKGAMGGFALGLDIVDEGNKSRFISDIVSGELADLKGWNIFVSRTVARGLRVGLGDKVEIVSPKGYETAFGWSPRIKKVNVVGIYAKPDDKGSIILPIAKAQLLFKLKGQYSRLEIRTKNTDLIDETRALLRNDLSDDYKVQSWKDFNRAYVSALDVERIVVMIILALVVLVAAFNIVAGQTMLVQEKGKGIAVIRTMGADKRSVMRIFIMTGALIGVAGTILGTALGLLVAGNFQAIISFLQTYVFAGGISAELGWLAEMTPVLSFGVVAFTFTFAIVISILATLYPAWRAANYDPVEALRYE